MDSDIKKPIYNYDTVVISGGAAKGIVSLGALQYALDNFMLSNVDKYIGTSSGAMIGYLLAIGYTPIEIITYICTHNLIEKIQHFNIVSMINGTGASSFTPIQEQLEKMTISKIGHLPTLKDLEIQYGKKLICVTYNWTKNQTEYLSADTNPNLPVLAAIRMSANLPFIFEKYHYGESYYIDGGISDNFPIDMGDKIGHKILGILIETDATHFKGNSNSDFLEDIYKLVFIPTTENIEHKIKEVSDKCTIVRLKYNLKTFNFNIDSRTKLDMFSKGYEQIKEFL